MREANSTTPEPSDNVSVGPPEQEANLGETLTWVHAFVKRRRWWIFLPTCCVAIASSILLPYVPKKYSSEATFVVVQQRVSPVYVAPSMTVAPSEVVRSLAREVLSRPRLLRIIDELRLFSNVKRSVVLADKMRDSITVEPLDSRGGDYNAFRLSYSGGSPIQAFAVTSRLAALFIEENQRTRGEQAEGTAKFLSDQLESAKAKLTEQEERLKGFKLRNLGQLPQEQQANLATMTALRTQLQSTTDNLTRARRLRESLDGVLTRELARLAEQKSDLLKKFTIQHPAVIAKDREIAGAQGLLEVLRGRSEVKGTSAPAIEDVALASLRPQIETNAGEILSLSNDETRLKSEIVQYQRRLSLTPIVEAELTTILRDYEQYSRDYTELLSKQLQSQLTASLEERQQGQHFRLVDPPTLPLEHSSPNHQKILLGGLAVGLALGLVLAILIEMKSHAFHFEHELTRSYSLPVVVTVPLILTPREVARRQWRHVFEWIAACILLVAIAAAEIHALRGAIQ